MRRSLPFLVLLLATAAACSKSSPDRSGSSEPSSQAPSAPAAGQPSESRAADSQARSEAGPNVGVTAAPGVAFNYRYEFELPPTRIAEVQEQHALACERLTVARCRITGMSYRRSSAHNIEAMLAFKLDPAVARSFGRDGTAAVVNADGLLSESEITGTDVGTQIRAAGRSIAEMQGDLQRIEAQLRAPRLDVDEKARLEEQAQQLREMIRAGTAQREEAQESLATTPMVYRYVSGDPTLAQSLQDTGDSFLESASVLLRIVIALLPWALAASLVAAIIIYARRRWPAKKTAVEMEPETKA
jgi:hypothetical protein